MPVLPADGKEINMIGLLTKSQALVLMLMGLVIVFPACSSIKVHQVGSHKVTVSRHGFEKKLHVDKDAAVPTFEYAGISTAGERLKVSIVGEKVTVNGRDYGSLRPGDSVFITDDGVAVNSLDYGESEKYLRANSTAETAVRN
jgi:hypothetical protein